MKTKFFLLNFRLISINGLHCKNAAFILLMLCIMFQNCTTAVNSLFEDAGLLDKNQKQISPHISKYVAIRISDYLGNEVSLVNTNIGLSYSYGINSRLNIKARFEFLFYGENLNKNIKFISIAPKFKIRKENLSMIIPFEYYFVNEIYLSPQLIYTKTIRENKLNLTIAPKFILPLMPTVTKFPISPGINVGMGISKDLSKYAIRPEFGFLMFPYNLEIYQFNFGIGYSRKF